MYRYRVFRSGSSGKFIQSHNTLSASSHGAGSATGITFAFSAQVSILEKITGEEIARPGYAALAA